jgi:hypothetical protein
MSLNQNLPARLLALATILVSLTLTAHADTYRFYVNNFDGYGSSLTFELPSSVPVSRNEYGYDNQVIQSALTDIIFQPGAFIPPQYRGDNVPPTVQNTTYEQQTVRIGFDDQGQGDFLLGPGVSAGDFHVYDGPGLLFQEGTSTALFTADNGVATFKLGTFGNVEIVNATPEPSTLCLFGTGIVGLVGVARRKLSS